MCWVAASRGADLAEQRGDDERAQRWRAGADEIKAEILDKGVSSRGIFRQHYETDDLDASLLLLPIMGFLPPDDERVKATVLAIADDLTKDGLVLRYRVEGTDTGFEGEEGTFTICSFWLVTALAMIGETKRAHALCQKLLSFAGPLLLYAEEIDTTTGQHLGNFPQAFTHLALIEAVSLLIASGAGERLWRVVTVDGYAVDQSAGTESACAGAFGGTANEVMHLRLEWLAVSVEPLVWRDAIPIHEDRAGIPVIGLACRNESVGIGTAGASVAGRFSPAYSPPAGDPRPVLGSDSNDQ